MDSPQQVYADLKIRISNLEALSIEDLKEEMAELKTSLKENVEACSLLLPEDIGEMVKHLRTVVGLAIVTASASKKTPKAKAPKFTSKELLDALDDDEF